MSTYTKDGISFSLNSDSVLEWGKSQHIDSSFNRNVIHKLINAVELDWNGANLPNADPNTGSSKTINDTSELLSLINTMQKEIYVLTAAVIALAQR